MKNLLFSVFFLMISSALWAFQPEMKTITLNDGEKVLTRLCLPEGPVKTIVFAIHGTGPNTYLNKRSGFNFYDVMAEGFCSQGVAFFSYNRRGVEVGDTAPVLTGLIRQNMQNIHRRLKPKMSSEWCMC